MSGQTDAREVFANNLQYYLNRENKSQTDLAEHMQVSSSTVSDWVNGNKYPRVDKMQKIADFLNVLMSNLTSPRGEAEDDIGFDDFTYAMANESKDLPEDKKQQLLDMARFLKSELDKEKKD